LFLDVEEDPFPRHIVVSSCVDRSRKVFSGSEYLTTSVTKPNPSGLGASYTIIISFIVRDKFCCEWGAGYILPIPKGHVPTHTITPLQMITV